jgi:hypothetical protein
LITDWVGLGLLDRPHKPGRGRGAGSDPGTWSDAQVQLFLALWRQRPHASIAELCNFPVYLWLFWGNDYVPLGQVRRAMNTWLARIRHIPMRAADDAAAQILSVVDEGRPTRARRDLLAEALRTEPPDLKQARDQLPKTAVPGGTITVAPGRKVEIDPELIMGLIGGRVAAEDQLAKLPDHLFEWARFFNLYTEGAYAEDQQRLVAHPRHGRLFPRRQHDDMIKRACANLLTLLGASLTVKINSAYTATFLHPEEWKDANVHGVIRKTEMRSDGLMVDFEVVTD